VSGVDELVAFVRRCLDEDERVVRQLLAEPGGFYLEAETDSVNIMTVGAYVYRWPPKRVLAEVEAKRQVLEAMEDQAREHLNTICNDPEAEGRYVQRAEFYRQEVARLLAQPYAGQDGWREEWAL
jgi:hypothetical protein